MSTIKRKSLLNNRFLAVALSIAMIFVTLVPLAAMAGDESERIAALDTEAGAFISISTSGDWTSIPGTTKKVDFNFEAPIAKDMDIYVPLPNVESFNVGDKTFTVSGGITGTWKMSLNSTTAEILQDTVITGVGNGDFLHFHKVGIEGEPGNSISVFDVTYRFANGTTKIDTPIDTTAYLVSGTDIVKADDKTILAKPNDTWSIAKSVESGVPTEFENGNFIERPYVYPVGDTYRITYKLALETTGNGNENGRIFQNNFTVVDTISGYRDGKVPVVESIKIGNPTSGTPILGSTYTPINGTSSTLTFTVPGNASGATNNTDVYVTILVDKDDYTNYTDPTKTVAAGYPHYVALAKISNQAKLTTNPVKEAIEPVTSQSAVVDTEFGWKQAPTEKPTLTIKKQIEAINLEPTPYTTAIRGIYDLGDVKFTLTDEHGIASNLTIDATGYASISNLLPGTYTLAEIPSTNSNFDVAASATLTVSEPNAAGISSLTSSDARFASNTNTITITNKSEKVGDLKVKVQKQKPYEIGMYENFTGKLVYLNVDGATMFTATSDSNGFATFRNVPVSGTYTLTGAEEAGFIILDGGVTGVTLSSNIENATLKYKKETGSFILSKIFQDPLGNPIAAPANYHATFKLYTKDSGGTFVDSGISFTLPEDIENGVVKREIKEGTYYLEETSLTINGAESAEYEKIDLSDNVNVHVEGGYYYSGPANNPLIVYTQGADASKDTYGIINKSTYGELAVQSFWIDADGDATDIPSAGEAFTATLKGSSPAVTYQFTTGSDGIAKRFLPEGTYIVTRNALGTNEIQTASAPTGTEIVVAARTESTHTYTVNGHNLAGGSQTQTVGFVKAKLPNVSGFKTNPAGIALPGATFTLYKLNNEGFYEVVKDNSNNDVTAEGATFTFTGLLAGTYIAVETTVPPNHEPPAWRSDFYSDASDTVLIRSIDAGLVPGSVPNVVVTTSDYSPYLPTVANPSGIKTLHPESFGVINVPNTELKIKTVQAKTGANLPGSATYEVYDITGGGNTLYTSVTAATGTTPSFPKRLLAGHTYKVIQTAITDDTYVLSDDYLTITVDADANKTYAWNESTRRANTLPASSTNPLIKDGATSVTAQFSNAAKPVIRIDKLGETQEIDSKTGKYEKEQLGGAIFKLYYEENGINFYAGSDGTWKEINNGEVVTDATGNLVLPASLTFDPNPAKHYKLLELSAPTVPGSPDLEYDLPSNPIEFTFGYVVYAENAFYHAEYELKNAYAGFEDDINVKKEGNSITITNVLEPHYLSLQKLSLKTKKYVFESDPANVGVAYPGTDGAEIDPASAEEPAMILGGSFVVKRWKGGNDNPPTNDDMADNDLWYDVSAWLDMGNNPDNYEGSRGYSGNLPAGYYMVTERWRDEINNGEPTELYVNQGGDYQKSGGTWTAGTGVDAPNWEVAPEHLRFLVDLTDSDDTYTNIQVGNTGMLNNANGSGAYRGDTLVQLSGTKTSWTQLTDSVTYNGLLNGVKFDLYPAYKDAAGNYVKFGPPIQHTIESGNLWGSGAWGNNNPDPGRFSSIKFYIADSIFKYQAGTEVVPEGYTGTYTKYVNLSDDAKTAVDALVEMTGLKSESTSEWVSTEPFHLALEEIGGLPANFTQSYPKTFGLDVPRNGLQSPYINGIIRAEDKANEGIWDTSLSDTEKYNASKSIKNLRGESRLELLKVAYVNREPVNIVNGKLQSVPNSFALYKAESAEPGSTKQFIKNITPQSTRNNYERLEPGYYYLKELAAPENFNISGSYRIVVPKADGTTNTIPAYNENNAANKPFNDGEYIGPLALTDNTKGNTIVAVTDYPLGQIKLANYWNGVPKADAALYATYEIVKTPATGFTLDSTTLAKDTGTTTGAVTSAGDGKTFTVEGNAVALLKNLPDGDYTIKLSLAGISSAAQLAHTANEALKDDSSAPKYINFTIAKGKVVYVPKTGADSVGSTLATNKNGIWVSTPGTQPNDTPSTVYTLNINHPGKGALVIRKDVVFADGTTNKFFSAETPGFSPVYTINPETVVGDFYATFTATPVNADGSPRSGSVETITWSKDTVDVYGDLVQPLSAGIWAIEETDVRSGYNKSDPRSAGIVYVKIEAPTTDGSGISAESGYVYLEKPTNITDAGSSVSNPLETINSKKVFKNYSNQGKLQILKYSDPTKKDAGLAGAEFEIYNNADPKVRVATITSSDATYTYELPAAVNGTQYYIKEIKAPTGLSLRDDLIPVKVYPAITTAAADTLNATKEAYGQVGYQVPVVNGNLIAILDAPLTSLNIAKETIYPEIYDADGTTKLVDKEKARVNALELKLYKYNGSGAETDIANWIDITPTGGAFTGSPAGLYEFTQLGIGKYKVIEVVDSGHAYLSNAGVFTNFALTPTIEIEHDRETNKLVVESNDSLNLVVDGGNRVPSGSDAFNATGALDAWYPSNLLTIHNGFIGIRFAAQKVDYDNGDLLSGATFELYKKGTPDILIDTKVTNAQGIAIFDPLYTTDTEQYYIKEKTAPTGYIASAYYDNNPKKDVSTATPLVIFKNKALANSVIGLDKALRKSVSDKVDVAEAALTESGVTGAATKPLRETGFTATYTFTPKEAKNILPMTNYTFEENAASMTFKGGIGTAATFAGTQPEYSYTQLRIWPSTAKDTPQTLDVNAKNVYVKVNNLNWELVTAEKVFNLDAGTKAITIQYSSTIPGASDTPTVGFDFKPGKIELDTAFEAFYPTSAQPEVSEIINTAKLSANTSTATTEVLTAVSGTSNEAKITVPVDQRPEVVISKTKTSATPSDGYSPSTGTNKTLVDYRITLTNNGNGAALGEPKLEKPVVVDYLPDGMSIALDADNKPIYTIDAPNSAKADDVSFIQDGNAAIWQFLGGNLAEGESIVIDLTVELSTIIVPDDLVNEVYGTSALPLSYSSQYPTGASFTSGMTSDGTVTAANTADYNKLNIIPELNDKGLFVKATDSIPVEKTGDIRPLKSIKVGSKPWYSGTTPQDVYPGDVISYRLILSNGFTVADAKDVTNVRISDTLPDDWSADLIAAWKWDEAVVRLSSSADSLVPVTDYTISLSDSDKTFEFVLLKDNGTLKSGDVLTIEYKTTALPTATEIASNLSIYEDNARKVATNSGEFFFTFGGNNQTPKSSVSAVFNAPDVHISGMVWEDKNYDGINARDANEIGAGNVKVSLYKTTDNGTSNVLVGETTTGTDGTYNFDAWALKSSYGTGIKYQLRYSLDEAIYANYRYTQHVSGANNSDVIDPTTPTVGVLDGKTGWFKANRDRGTKDAGIYTTSEVSGFVWRDVNANGQRDTGEPLVAGVDVRLTGTNLLGDPVNITHTTNSTGAYLFGVDDELLASDSDGYTLTFDKSGLATTNENYQWTVSNSNGIAVPVTDVYGDEATADVDIAYAQTVIGSDAGIVPYVHFSGFVWLDANANGARGASENGIQGVVVNLRNASDTIVATTTTGANGGYVFDKILSGTYAPVYGTGNTNFRIEFVNPNNDRYVFTRNGAHHTATNMRGTSASGGLVNDYTSAATAPTNNGIHSTDALNAGLYATPTYTVTYLPNGGSGVWGIGSYSIVVKPGRSIPNHTVVRQGYNFTGWYQGSFTAAARWNFATDRMPTRNVTITAGWTFTPVPPVTPPTEGGGEGGDDVITTPPTVIGGGTVPQDPGTAIDEPVTPKDPGVADWSLLSLILSVLALLSIIVMIRRYRQERKDRDGEEYDEHRWFNRIVLTFAIVAGILTPAYWLWVDNLKNPMEFINKYTIFVAIIFAVNVVFHVIYNRATKKAIEEAKDEKYAAE